MTDASSAVSAPTIHIPKGTIWKNAGRIGLEFFNQNPRVFVSSLLLLIASGLFEGAGFLSLVPLVDAVTLSNPEDWSPVSKFILKQLQAIGLEGTTAQITGLFLAFICIKAALLFSATYFFQSSIIRYAAELRLTLIRGMMDAQWGFFTETSSGRLTNTICQEAQGAAGAAKQLITLASFLIQTFIYAGSVFLISTEFTVAALVAGVLMYVSRSGLVRLSRKEGAFKTEVTREYNGRIVDWLHGIKPLKAMGRNEPITVYLGDLTEKLRKSQTRLTLADRLLAVSQEPFIAVGLVGTMAFSISVLELQPASLLVGVALFARIMGRVGSLQKVLTGLATSEASYYGFKGTLEQVTQAKEQLADAETGHAQATSGTSGGPKGGQIKLDAVSVRYEDKGALSNVSVAFKKGTLTALLGPSGAGKSTILDLLARLREPDGGCILVDGSELVDLPLTSWRMKLGYVPQEMTLLSDTIRNNLLLGYTVISENDIWRALELAEIADDVRDMPNGLDTWVGERGQRFSGGQRQRFSIARALVHSPDLLLLDEATSALDHETEMSICRMLQNLTPEITVVATAHRPELEKWAHHIIRLNEGSVVEDRWVPSE
jgi:ATP-binding cassette, subfamily C, bacterial